MIVSVKKMQRWAISVSSFIDNVFAVTENRTTIQREAMLGVLHFISCLYVLPVIPNQMAAAGYNKVASIEATALACSIGCVLAAFMTNLPFVIAPPTAVSIYLAVSLQRADLNQAQGDTIVILSGIALLAIGILKPVTHLVTKLIPDCIQSSTAVGIGLITALAGAIELELVMPGKYTILEMGPITPAIVIATVSVTLIAVATHYKYRGAFVSGMVFGTCAWWWYANEWPDEVMSWPHFDLEELSKHSKENQVVSGLLNLVFLYVLTVNGIAKSLADLGGLSGRDGAIPRGNWLLMVCGLTTILSGCFSGPPILISPETAVGIKAGAKTGLSTLVCGILFFFSLFFCPLLKCVPPAGTSPMLILVGMLLFINVNRIKWNVTIEAIPAFFVLLLIPFTYSILQGVGFGYVLFVAIGLGTGELYQKFQEVFLRRAPYIAKSTSSNILSLVGAVGEGDGGGGGGLGGGGGGGTRSKEKCDSIDAGDDSGMLLYAPDSPQASVASGRRLSVSGSGVGCGGPMIGESFTGGAPLKSPRESSAQVAAELGRKLDDNSRYADRTSASDWDLDAAGVTSMHSYV